MRKPFQGVWNIIRFNWHFYVIYAVAMLLLFIISLILSGIWQLAVLLIIALATLSTILSLWASYYVYDISGLYQLNFLEKYATTLNVVNINAGFDETSMLLYERFHEGALQVLDFYHPEKHTEVSIKRARKAYPPYPNTKQVSTTALPLPTASVDLIINMLAAHEIRDEKEQLLFFKELKRILAPTGEIIVVEHLRDTANFLVYNIGFLHFHARQAWIRTFKEAGLTIKSEIKHTPFISIFTLTHGNPS